MLSIEFEIPRCTAPKYITDVIGDYYSLSPKTERQKAPPGHRFLLYFHALAGMGEVQVPERNRNLRRKLQEAARKADWKELAQNGGRFTASMVSLKNQKRAALLACTGMGKTAKEFLRALEERQRALIKGDQWWKKAVLISPLATGLGNPHPVENGFAFLPPYGIPYLSGSSVKGVLRRACEEIALFSDSSSDGGWRLSHVWALFGFDENSLFFKDQPDRESCPFAYDEWSRWQAAYRKWLGEIEEKNPDPTAPANTGSAAVGYRRMPGIQV